MGGRRTRSSPAEDAGEPEVCEYEQERQANIAENERRMVALGLLESVEALHNIGRAKKVPRKNPSLKHTFAPPPTRRSSRLQGAPVPTYKELSEREINRTRQPRQTGGKNEKEIPEGSQPEYYTEEHEKLLGSYEQEWELTIDGYNPDRKTRIYDPVNGKTCHQCRQKTLGLRTWCSQCEALQGQFCGDCLFTRYGENILETQKNKNWICPVCRGICNCSFCRPKRGWAPTGMLYRMAKAKGYKSVAHYLIFTRRAPPAVPGEGSGVDEYPVELSADEDSREGDSEAENSVEHYSELHCEHKHSSGLDGSARAPTRQSLSFSNEVPSRASESRLLVVA